MTVPGARPADDAPRTLVHRVERRAGRQDIVTHAAFDRAGRGAENGPDPPRETRPATAARRPRQPAPGPDDARWRSQWSASTMATIASAIGTNRGSRQGSWRPLVRMVVGSPAVVTVA